MKSLGKVEGLNKAIKKNFMIFIGALTGMVIAETYFFTETGVNLFVAVGAVIAFNIGNFAAKKIRGKQGYDEREFQNMDRGLVWGFIIATSMLGVDLASSFSWSKAEILIISASTAVLVMICKNYQQTEGLWKKFVNNWKHRISGGKEK